MGLVIYGSLDTLSGGYLYDRMLVERLRSLGDEVEVISLPWRGYARHLTDNLAEEWFERLRDAPIDLLLQDELNHPSLVWVNRRLRHVARYPIVSIVHHLRSSELRPAWQNFLYRAVERSYLASVDGFVFNSQTTRSMVERLAGGQRPAVVAYPAGDRPGQPLSPEQVAARARQGGPLRVLFVGNLIPREGLHILLDALARLDPAAWRLTIVGSAASNRAYARLIADTLGRTRMLGQVTHSGPLSAAELAGYYAASHLLAVPSSYEGFGIVYLEGMGFGLPAIAGSAGSAGEIITHGVDGFLVAPGDAAALAACIQSLIEDRERLLAMSLAARARFDSYPTWAQTAGLICDFLHGFGAIRR